MRWAYAYVALVVGGMVYGYSMLAAWLLAPDVPEASVARVQAESGPDGVPCIDLPSVSPALTPVDLSASVIACAEADQIEMAADLFMLMLARAHFDTARVTDYSAHAALGALSQMTFSRAYQRVGGRVEALQETLADRGAGEEQGPGPICTALWQTGVPQHDPSYMVNDGMAAFQEGGPPPLRQNFDAEAAWEATLTSYLNCPPAQ